jgi:hypothetical protein
MLTEHEAWCAILDVLEGYGMPRWNSGCKVGGLCGVLTMMNVDGVISDAIHLRMNERLQVGVGPRKIWLARPGQIAPRIPYVRRFIEETKP